MMLMLRIGTKSFNKNHCMYDLDVQYEAAVTEFTHRLNDGDARFFCKNVDLNKSL